MLWLAFDGSLNSDWLTHYAVRCALQSSDPRVKALFVRDGSLSDADVEQKFERAARICKKGGVSFEGELLTQADTVEETLIRAIPAREDQLLVCGARIQRRSMGFLRGTVSEALLRRAPFRVLALRIVNPGLLGESRRLLLPVMGRPEGVALALPFIEVLASELEQLFVLSVHPPAQPAGFWHRLRTKFSLHDHGERRSYLDRVEAALKESLGSELSLDRAIIVSDDAAGEIVLAAKQHRSQLILLGHTRRPLPERLILGTPGEKVLRYAPCDVGVYGGVG